MHSCRRVLVLAVALLAASGRPVAAQPLTTAFTYQGELTDAGALAGGPYDLRFRLYDAPTGGAQVGGVVCLNNVDVANGRFTVALDFGAAFSGQQLFLETDARADTGRNCGNATGFVTLSPRQPLTAAPNALFSRSAAAATDSTRLGGQVGAFYQNAQNLTGGTIPDGRLAGAYTGPLSFSNAGNTFTGSFIGSGEQLTDLNASNLTFGTLPIGVLPNPFSLNGLNPTCIVEGINGSSTSQSAGVCGRATSPFGQTIGVYGQSDSVAGTGVWGWASNTTGVNQGVFGASESVNGRGVYGLGNATTGLAIGGWFQSQSSAGMGAYGLAAAATGTTSGLHGQANSTAGRGVYGLANAATGSTDGVLGESHSTTGNGVRGLAAAGTGVSTGVFGQSNSTNGRGVYGFVGNAAGPTVGVSGESSSPDGAGVFGHSTSTTGFFATGVSGLARSTDGRGVSGSATATTGMNYGGRFESSSRDGTGVYGRVIGSTLGGIPYGVYGLTVGSNSGRGVLGWASANAGTVYGVYGTKDVAPGGFGVFSNGDMGSSGLKPFRIDHPDDPENKYLYHYAAESPEVMNFYSGKVDLDGAGEAVVELPAYFAKINADPRYTLTALGTAMPMLHVAVEISGAALARGAAAGPGEPAPTCTFVIAGGAPGGRVSWRVEAVRNDLYARTRGVPVEVLKQGVEKGTYQHPDLYGQPPEKGIDRRRDNPRE